MPNQGFVQGLTSAVEWFGCTRGGVLYRAFIPTLRVSGAKGAPPLPRQGERPRDLYIAFGSLLSIFGITGVAAHENEKGQADVPYRGEARLSALRLS